MRIVGEISNNLQFKAQALFSLGLIANRLQMYEQAIVLDKKSLQYAWKCNLVELELEIYEQIGLNYFYLGNMLKESTFYHQKFVMADYEIEDSPLKIISIAVIDRQMKQMSIPPLKEFNRLFLVKLSLPIANKFDDSIQCDYNKNTTYENCLAEKLINQIILEQEFILFELDSPVYSRIRNLQLQQEYRCKQNKYANKDVVDFSFVDEERRRQGRRLKQPKMIKFKSIFGNYDTSKEEQRIPSVDLSEPFKFKIPLQKLIQRRLNEEHDLKSIFQQVKMNVMNLMKKSNAYERQKVNLNHMKEENQQKYKIETNKPQFLMKKYQKYFLSSLNNSFQ